MVPRSSLPQEVPFSLLIGGFHRCDPSWNKPADGIDRCYKLYLPVRGQARLVLKDQEVIVRPGYAYLIPGFHLVRQECRRRLDVYWVHFVPESLHLTFLLSHVTQVHSWRRGPLEYWRAVCKEMPRLFEDGRPALLYRVQAMLMDLVADVLQICNLDGVTAVDPIFERLKPAIAFMDRHLLENPSLAEIARAVHLAPNYFHRKFTGTFHVTPLNYMLRRRLNLGRRLLLSTDLTVARIAERCGFSSAFHFSKLLRKHSGLSPRQFRRQAMP